MSEFFRRLNLSKRKRVPLDEVKRVYYSLYPEIQNNPERQTLLLQELRDLASQGRLTLPAAGSWEKVGHPPLPTWVALVREVQLSDYGSYAEVPWVPELGFWPELKPVQLADAKAINDKALGAFLVPLPLPYRQANAPGKPVLVVENHNSFWSFGEWNQTALRYSALVYGAGEAFRSTGQALGQVLQEVGGDGAEYLGDLDPKGVGIPLEFNRASSAQDLQVRPALDLYRWLLVHGRSREKPECREAAAQMATTWLGQELGAAVAEIWAQGRWIPQEALGFEQLNSWR